MTDKRMELLSEVYDIIMSENHIKAIKVVDALKFAANQLQYQYMEEKGYIKVFPKSSDGSIAVGMTVEGIDFYEDVKDIAPAYWSEK
ncbi:hypothetical protein [Neobacillus drentensis]|uniref:hypothetical protein n=1 Tax=Neobacillus drentensis TaxID=220684 RepID=UPI003000AE44